MSSDTQTSNEPLEERPARKVRPRVVTSVIVHEQQLNPVQEALRGFAFGVGFTGAVLVCAAAWHIRDAAAAA